MPICNAIGRRTAQGPGQMFLEMEQDLEESGDAGQEFQEEELGRDWCARTAAGDLGAEPRLRPPERHTRRELKMIFRS